MQVGQTPQGWNGSIFSMIQGLSNNVIVPIQKYADRKQDTEADDAFRTMQNDGVSRKFDMVVVDSLLRCGSNVSYAEDVLLKSFLPAGIHFAVF